MTNLGLENYIKKSRKCLLTAARSVGNDSIEPIPEITVEAKKQKMEKRTISWKEKMLQDQFLRQTKEAGDQDRWQWLCNGTLKREIESLIFASQEQAIRTNVIKGKFYRSQQHTKCRICSRSDETINHIVSECLILAQKEHKKRHDWIGSHIHWEICRANGIHVKSKWYEHLPEAVIENDSCKILWDFTIQVDHFITARRP